MDNEVIGIVVFMLGAVIMVIVGVLYELVEETKVEKANLLDPDTGEYRQQYHEVGYVSEPTNSILIMILIIGLIMFIGGLVGAALSVWWG